MAKPIIHLWDHVGTGLIVKFATGVIYSNQTGGTSCMQPQLEGVFIPLGNDVAVQGNELLSAENELTRYFEGPKHEGTGARDGLDGDDADSIDQAMGRTFDRSWVAVDREKLGESMEAWVWVQCRITVTVYLDYGDSLLNPFIPKFSASFDRDRNPSGTRLQPVGRTPAAPAAGRHRLSTLSKGAQEGAKSPVCPEPRPYW